jgi:uncharacterized damage-inducible protein DinB
MECMSTLPEPWLRNTHSELPAVIRAVVHALELSAENVENWCGPLGNDALNARPADIAPVAFHLRHIVRSLDRLLTYAEGSQLSVAQIEALKRELDANATQAEVFAEFQKGIEDAIRRVRAFSGTELEQSASVGRKGMPTTVGGLLVHCADHTQRHTGQAITTAKVVSHIPSF